MKTVCIVSDMVNDTPTTKVEKFRFTELYPFLAQKIVKGIRTEKINLIEGWKWFNSVEEAEQYLEKL
jgi:hypothetical protein